MRTILGVIIAATSLSTTAIAGPKEDALQVLDKWAQAFAASDVDGITKLYAPDALFLGTTTKTIVNKPDGIRAYFQAVFSNGGPRNAKLNEYDALVLSDTVVEITGLDTITATRDGKPTSNNGRVTFVVQRRGQDWVIAQFHRSAMPN